MPKNKIVNFWLKKLLKVSGKIKI